MARSPAPPGPPPRHYRPPGSPPPTPGWGGPAPLAATGSAGPPPPTGASAGAVTAVAIVTLVLGLVVGFFLGRATEADDTPSSAPPLTSPSTSTSRPPGDTIPPSPTSAPAAPPSTDLAPDTIGSLEDPVPVGQSYILGLYEIEVRGVERDAGPTLRDHDPSNPPAPPGEQHLMVEVAVRFTDEFGLGNPAAIPFLVSDGTARWNDFDALCGSVPESLFETGPLERGDEAVGNVCFTVPSDVVGDLRFGTEGFDGPVYFALPE